MSKINNNIFYTPALKSCYKSPKDALKISDGLYEISRIGKLRETENRLEVTRGPREGGMVSYCLTSTEFVCLKIGVMLHNTAKVINATEMYT